MSGSEVWSRNSSSKDQSQTPFSFGSSSNSTSFTYGGLSLEHAVSFSFVSLISHRSSSSTVANFVSSFKQHRAFSGLFLSVSMRNDGPGFGHDPKVCLVQNGDGKSTVEEEKLLTVSEGRRKREVIIRGR